MPAARSTIRTVPGGNAGGVDVPAPVDVLLRGGSSSPEAPTSAAMTTTRAPSPSSHRVRSPRGAPVSLVISSSSDSQRGGCCSTGAVGISPTATPGPTGVVTSDQAAPFHQRAVPGAPSGSAYQPGGGGDDAVMRSR